MVANNRVQGVTDTTRQSLVTHLSPPMHLQGLHSGAGGKPVVVAGDLNCAHQPIDIHDPKRNLRSAGFTQEERDSFGTNLLSGAGLVDTYRMQHPQAVGYTYYSYRMKGRETGKGWRLDYMLVRVCARTTPVCHSRCHRRSN